MENQGELLTEILKTLRRHEETIQSLDLDVRAIRAAMSDQVEWFDQKRSEFAPEVADANLRRLRSIDEAMQRLRGTS
jgi:hypothetical protein